ncbi:deoxynucleotidyltransferase terminal-interacting protein 1 [Eupeodes corollae]|uniref:deoxynucleotidyltransferase terminal-interacting protein 1 n=1 Tax=Eupeodes corollae TaxID=290404 RepID=UPI002492B5D4|nr:deoxynucleotidyltransferase terminal-interacting protein 1 [Eupeodes corollae]
MVIQRSWKIQTENGKTTSILQMNATSSSEDSNGSNQTNTSIATSMTNNSLLKMDQTKYVTTPQMAENVLGRLKQRLGSHVSGRKSSSDAAMRSLELLRITIQIAFDKEVDAIAKKFIDMYFKPAFKNIKENLGDHAVTEEMGQKMICALLENSKTQYNPHRNKPTATISQVPLIPVQISTDQSNTKPESSTQTTMAVKRAAPKPSILESPGQTPKKPTISSTAPAAGQQQPSQPNQPASLVQQQQLPQQQQQPNRPPTVAPPRRQIFWNTAAISTETNFVLDVQANQAFGFGTDGKERLASKHPELIRYLPDGQDRDWLVEQKIIPAQNRNSRFLFLIHDEVKTLGETALYKDRENLNLSILHIFKIPNFIIQKMKLFFIDLNIKSRGLITNSYSNIANSSHLRNALLQGSNQAVVSASSVSGGTTTSVASSINSSNSVSTSTDTVTSQPKPKSSLSSSHATLTALLTNNNNGGSGVGNSKMVTQSEPKSNDSCQNVGNSIGSLKNENVKKE